MKNEQKNSGTKKIKSKVSLPEMMILYSIKIEVSNNITNRIEY